MNAKEILTWTLINAAATVLASVILYYFFRHTLSTNHSSTP